MKVNRILSTVPAVLLSAAALSLPHASANNINEEDKNIIYNYDEDKTNKNDKATYNWAYWLFGAGAAVGTGIGLGIHGLKRKKQNNIEEIIDEKQLKKDREAVFKYTDSIIEDFRSRDVFPYHVDPEQYMKEITPFINKYPDRKEPLLMATIPLGDIRLYRGQAESVFRGLVYKALSTDEEWAAAEDYAYMNNCDNYEEIVDSILFYQEIEPALNSAKEDAVNKTESIKTDEGPQERERTKATISINAISPGGDKFRFSNIGGNKEILEDLTRSIVYPIKMPEAFDKEEIKRGFLLYGPPGTGKTFLAKATANESGVYCYEVRANELAGSYVGETEANWKAVFAKAKETAPSIILVDEIDAIAAKRGKGNQYADQALSTILSYISQLAENDEQVYIIGTTNNIDLIDPALIRSGRLGDLIEAKEPQNPKEIGEIFDIHIKNKKVDSTVDREKLFKYMYDLRLSGSDIVDMIKNASMHTKERTGYYAKLKNGTFTKEDKENLIINQEDFDYGLDKIKASKGSKVRKIGFK